MSSLNRRALLRGAGTALVAGPLTSSARPPGNPVRIGLIGCGGRGRHDASVLIAHAGAQIVALADLFEDKLGPAKQEIDERMAKEGLPPVAPSRLYHGSQSARQLAESDADAILIAITPYYYPAVLEMVAASGKHLYCEKPVATDVAGCLKVLGIARRLDGKAVFHVGLQVPWASAMQEMERRIRSGAIGEIVSAASFFFFGGGNRTPPAGTGPEEARLRTWAGDRILSGDIIVEQNVHSIDKLNWIFQTHPVSATARGGRKARTDFGDVWDHFVAELVYPNNAVVSFHSTQFLKGWSDAGERFFGTRGSSESHYTGGVRIYGDQSWDAGVTDIIADAEANKMRAFVSDIRNGRHRNEAVRGVESTLSAILVRTAAYQGREVTWDAMVSSNASWDPQIDLKQFG